MLRRVWHLRGTKTQIKDKYKRHVRRIHLNTKEPSGRRLASGVGRSVVMG